MMETSNQPRPGKTPERKSYSLAFKLPKVTAEQKKLMKEKARISGRKSFPIIIE